MKNIIILFTVSSLLFGLKIKEIGKELNYNLAQQQSLEKKYKRSVVVGHRGYIEKLSLRNKKFELRRSFPQNKNHVVIKGHTVMKNDSLFLMKKSVRIKKNENSIRIKYSCKEIKEFNFDCEIDTLIIKRDRLIKLTNGKLYEDVSFMRI